MTEENLVLPVTPLDDALSVVRRNANEASYFYDAFLNTDVYVPVRIPDSETGLGRPVGWDEKFQPLFLKYQGTKVVPVFDQLERLEHWAEPRTPDYLVLRAHVFLAILASDTAIILNMGTPWNHLLQADILERLRQAMKPITPT